MKDGVEERDTALLQPLECILSA